MSDAPSNAAPGLSGSPRRSGRWSHPRVLVFYCACLLFAGASWWALTASRNPLVRIPGAKENPPAPTPVLSGAWWAHPYEINAARRLPVLGGDLLAVDFAPSGRDGWILGRGNLLLHTSDSGETWKRVVFELTAPAPYDPSSPVQSPARSGAKGAQLQAPRHPLAVIQLAGMAEPQKQSPAPANILRDLPIASPAQQNAPNAAAQTKLPSQPGPESAKTTPSIPAPRALELTRLRFRNDHSGLALTNTNKVWATEDGGRTWAPVAASQYGNTEYGLQQSDPSHVLWGSLTWDVTAKGEIRCDGKWSPKVFGHSGTPLTAIAAADASRGWVVGNEGRVLRSIDGGRSWYRASMTEAEARSLGPYIWFPPPLYALALLGVVSLMVVGWQMPERHVEQRSSIQDILLSDRPLAPGEPDVLGFNALALGLSAFLRNQRTEPPLTIAITGAWGSGKSSLMNLLRGDLERHGIRPVWFNAWHHQTEEHLLAALLENIRSQAVPGLLSDGGVMFRWRLLMMRLRNDWARWAVIGGVFVFSAGFVATSDRFSIDGVLQLANRTLAAVGIGEEGDDAAGEKSAKATKAEEKSAKEESTHQAAHDTASALLQPSGLIAAASLIAGILKLVTAMRAFAAKPSNLLLSQSSGFRLKDLGEQTSFRYHFAREFDEVTTALGARRMVIFIDDLDRCQPKEIYEMLESTNFLVSCGSCFVVLGLARERIERAIGLVFKDLAEFEQPELDDDADPDRAAPVADETETDKQQQFAEQYLEKLINIEVPVPKPDEADYHRLFETRGEPAQPFMRQRLAGALTQGGPVFALLATIVGLGIAGLVIGENARTQAKLASADAVPPVETVSRADAAKAVADASTARTPASFAPGSSWSPTVWWFVPGIALLSAMAVWRLNSRPAVMVMDSAEFTRALDRYLPALAQKPGTTPRSLKRFVNRVRYYAMMQRAQAPERTQWEAFVEWFGRMLGRRPRPASSTPMPPRAAAPAAELVTPPPAFSPDSRPAFASQPTPAAAAAPAPAAAPVVRERHSNSDLPVAEVVIPEADLVTLSALKDWGVEGREGEQIALAASRISPAIRAKFEALRSGVHMDS